MTQGGMSRVLLAVLAVGMLVVPRLTRAITRLARPETTVVAMIGICFGFALLALLLFAQLPRLGRNGIERSRSRVCAKMGRHFCRNRVSLFEPGNEVAASP